MNEESSKRSNFKFKYYVGCLKRDYVYEYIYEGKHIKKINHLRVIFDLLAEDPYKLWEEDFPYEVERYERKKFGKYMKARTPHHIRDSVKNLRRESPELIEKLCEHYKNNILTKEQKSVISKLVKIWQPKKN